MQLGLIIFVSDLQRCTCVSKDIEIPFLTKCALCQSNTNAIKIKIVYAKIPSSMLNVL